MRRTESSNGNDWKKWRDALKEFDNAQAPSLGRLLHIENKESAKSRTVKLIDRMAQHKKDLFTAFNAEHLEEEKIRAVLSEMNRTLKKVPEAKRISFFANNSRNPITANLRPWIAVCHIQLDEFEQAKEHFSLTKENKRTAHMRELLDKVLASDASSSSQSKLSDSGNLVEWLKETAKQFANSTLQIQLTIHGKGRRIISPRGSSIT